MPSACALSLSLSPCACAMHAIGTPTHAIPYPAAHARDSDGTRVCSGVCVLLPRQDAALWVSSATSLRACYAMSGTDIHDNVLPAGLKPLLRATLPSRLSTRSPITE
eukprot:488099-Rhodomonas_salina.1